MNSFTPAANGRAGAGFQVIKAGPGIIFRAVWHRALLWLLVRFLPLVILTCLGAYPAHANGVSTTIGNGQTVTGTVTGSGSDSYSFNVTAGGTFDVSISETGIHDPSFTPSISLTGPGVSGGRGLGRSLYARLERRNAAAGPWTVTVDRSPEGGDSGGGYALTLVQVSAAGGNIGSLMSPGVPASGSISRGSLDVRTFKGVAGRTATMTYEGTSANGFDPDITVLTPTGDLAGGFGCLTSCAVDVSLNTDGVYTVLVSKADDNDVTGEYTLSVK